MSTSCGVNVLWLLSLCGLTGRQARQTSHWYHLCSLTGSGDTEVEQKLRLYNFSANQMLFFAHSLFFFFSGLSFGCSSWSVVSLTSLEGHQAAPGPTVRPRFTTLYFTVIIPSRPLRLMSVCFISVARSHALQSPFNRLHL